jgi:hypothetical protein
VAEALADTVPPDSVIVLADQDQLRRALPPGLSAVPFPGRDGTYWGPPADDTAAIRELEALRRAGARFFALAWPAFWWRDHYPRFWRHVTARVALVRETADLVLLDLRGRRVRGPARPPLRSRRS